MTRQSSPVRWVVFFAVGGVAALVNPVAGGFFGCQAFAQAPGNRSPQQLLRDDIDRLKVMLGFDMTTSVKQIVSAFKKDMEAYAGKVPEEQRCYREVFKFLQRDNDELKRLVESLQSARKVSQPGPGNQAVGELSKQREAFNRERERLALENSKLQERLVQEREQMTRDRDQLNARLQQCSETIARLHAVLLNHEIDPKEAAAAGLEPRTWTNATGQFSVKAELVEVKDGHAMLRRSDGQVIAVAVDKLSKADRDYLSSLNQTTPLRESPKQPVKRDSPKDDAARIRELVPAASAMARQDMDKLARSPTAPKASDLEEKSLTLMLFTLEPKDTEEAKRQFRFLTEGTPKPTAIAREIYRVAMRAGNVSLLKGPVTFVNADRITDFTCEVDGDTAEGSVSFKVPELYQGKVDYVARRKEHEWQIEEFVMSTYDIHLVRNTEGTWEEK